MSQEIKDRFKQFVAPTYGRFPITLDRGTTQMPAASPDMPGYDRLYRQSQQAGKGKRVRAFHESLHANQIAQFRAGRLRAGGMISDAFDMAAVDMHGAHIDRRSR